MERFKISHQSSTKKKLSGSLGRTKKSLKALTKKNCEKVFIYMYGTVSFRLKDTYLLTPFNILLIIGIL